MTNPTELQYSLLDEPIIRYRRAADAQTVHVNLPQLFVALAADEVRDYPALRPHQRHPWHAFLVQLAAIALHKAERTDAFETATEWRNALLALTPNDPDGAAWCLVTPPDRPAFMQAAVLNGGVSDWKSKTFSADEIDMLVTSKNHDVKGSRARRAKPEDWLLALMSLQTQEGVLGSGNYGISRMNRGYASKPGVGVAVRGRTGKRWSRDIAALQQHREKTVADRGLQGEGGLALVWLVPWDGVSSLNFSALDPFYIEICRRLRLQSTGDVIHAIGTGSKVARIAAKELNGLTGDAWTPVDVEAGKALTITGSGFTYKLVSELMFGGKYQAPAAQSFGLAERGKDLDFITQGITRGQGKTEGYHERRVPISPKVRGLLADGQKEVLARLAAQRIAAVGEVRKVLWVALVLLFANGVTGNNSDGNKTKATKFSEPFELAEDPRFFDDLNEEAESADPAEQRLKWLLALVARAEAFLRLAFDAGPRNGAQKYRAQSAALGRFHGVLRSTKFPISELVNHYRQQPMTRQEETLEHT